MKGRPRKEKKEKVALPLDKKQNQPQPIKSADSPPTKETTTQKPINEEAIKSLPVIQDLNLKIIGLAETFSGSLMEVNKRFQSYDTQAKDTNEKITALGQAVSILNDEFSKFMETLQAKLASPPVAPGGGNTPPGTSMVSSERVSIEKPPVAEPLPASAGDKIMQYLNILASLAGSGQPSGGGGASATDLLKTLLELQDKAEERALKRQETSVKSIAMIANLITGKRMEILEEIKPEPTNKHL